MVKVRISPSGGEAGGWNITAVLLNGRGLAPKKHRADKRVVRKCVDRKLKCATALRPGWEPTEVGRLV